MGDNEVMIQNYIVQLLHSLGFAQVFTCNVDEDSVDVQFRMGRTIAGTFQRDEAVAAEALAPAGSLDVLKRVGLREDVPISVELGKMFEPVPDAQSGLGHYWRLYIVFDNGDFQTGLAIVHDALTAPIQQKQQFEAYEVPLPGAPVDRNQPSGGGKGAMPIGGAGAPRARSIGAAPGTPQQAVY